MSAGNPPQAFTQAPSVATFSKFLQEMAGHSRLQARAALSVTGEGVAMRTRQHLRLCRTVRIQMAGAVALAVLALPVLAGAPGAAAATATAATAPTAGQNMGAHYDSTAANITFRVYSSRATRIDVYLYAAAYGSQEKVCLPADQGRVHRHLVGDRVGGDPAEHVRDYRRRVLRLSRLGPQLAVLVVLDQGLLGRVRQRRGLPGQPLRPQQAAVRPLRPGTEPRPAHPVEQRRRRLRHRCARPRPGQRHLRAQGHRAGRRHHQHRHQADQGTQGRRRL